MKSKYSPEPSLAFTPEWLQLSDILKNCCGRHGDWTQLRSVRAKKEAACAVPILLEWARSTDSYGLRFNIILSLQNRFTYPWIKSLLDWLPQEPDGVIQMLIANCLEIIVDSAAASSVLGVLRDIPSCNGGAHLARKLYKFESVRSEIEEWLLDLDRTGRLEPSLRGLAKQIGIIENVAKVPSVNKELSKRPAKTIEVLDESYPAVEEIACVDKEPTLRIQEMWSGEVGLEELSDTIDSLEKNYNISAHIGRDLLGLLKRRKDEGVLVKVSSHSDSSGSWLSLHITLEDVDTATLRLISVK